MILKIDTMRIDVDLISYMNDEKYMIIVGGQGVYLDSDNYKILKKAFDHVHKSHMYDKDLKLNYGRGK
jgi:glycine/serine hydroxymethyltransferase